MGHRVIAGSNPAGPIQSLHDSEPTDSDASPFETRSSTFAEPNRNFGQSGVHSYCQLPTAEAVGLSVDSRSNSKLEWTLDTSFTFNVPDFRAS